MTAAISIIVSDFFDSTGAHSGRVALFEAILIFITVIVAAHLCSLSIEIDSKILVSMLSNAINCSIVILGLP